MTAHTISIELAPPWIDLSKHERVLKHIAMSLCIAVADLAYQTSVTLVISFRAISPYMMPSTYAGPIIEYCAPAELDTAANRGRLALYIRSVSRSGLRSGDTWVQSRSDPYL